MCTVSLISVPVEGEPCAAGLRVVCNRDESVRRPDAAAPRWREVGAGVRGIWPADGEAGGTWIGANTRGLVMSLLNLNGDAVVELPLADRLISRGKIIPGLMACGTAEEAVAGLGELELDRFAPFRLVAAGAGETEGHIFEASWDRRELRVVRHAGLPACFASSGLGDRLVRGRVSLFEGMVVGAGSTAEAQDLFHHHTWADHPELSVMMSRAEARTVSVTTVEVTPLAGGRGVDVRMRYAPIVARDRAEGGARSSVAR